MPDISDTSDSSYVVVSSDGPESNFPNKRTLAVGSSKLALTDGGAGSTASIDVTEANLTLQNLGGTLTVGKGGTGATTLTGILKGNGTSAFTAVTAPSGAIVGDTDTQTLSAKTLTTPIINGSTFGDVGITNSDSPYTVLSTKTVIRADASSGAITINLPTAASIAGRTYKIYRTDVVSSTNIITIDGNSTETIDGNTTYRLYPGEWIHIESDGANWQVIARPSPNTHGYYFLKNSTNNRRYVAGISNMHMALSTSTTSPAANTLWALPLIVSKTTKFDTISFHITTSDAGDNANAGIYYDNGNCYPGAKIFNTGSISTGSTGVKDTTITSSLQVFQPGLYWLAWETSAPGCQIRILPATTSGYIAIGGADSTMSTTNAAYGYSVAHTYNASLPDPYTASATLLTSAITVSNPVPAISLRAI